MAVNISDSANQLIRAVIANELRQSAEDPSRWAYEVATTDEDGKQRVKRVVELRDGSVERLLAINGRPLNSQEETAESKRIVEFVNSKQEQEKASRAQEKDAAQCIEFLKKIPEAFMFDDGGRVGDFRRLTFKPNPSFQSHSWQDRILHAMEGEMLVSPSEFRLVAMRGRLVEDVKFGGGLLGHLQRGGEFHLERHNIGDGHWEMTNLEVNMTGKALLFKSISIQHKEAKSSFRRVGDNLAAHDAAGELNSNIVLASEQR
ncbi:MAG: hypothetical protein ABSE92_06275 [Terriglobales bacterium]